MSRFESGALYCQISKNGMRAELVEPTCLISRGRKARRVRFSGIPPCYDTRMKIKRGYGALACFGIVYGVSACTASKVACQVIKTANDACTVIEMIGADGKPVQVPITNEELQGFGKTAAARREAEKKAGVPIGTPLPFSDK